jgi:TRAP-type C4-dicarboxylate transport system permease large subunit
MFPARRRTNMLKEKLKKKKQGSTIHILISIVFPFIIAFTTRIGIQVLQKIVTILSFYSFLVHRIDQSGDIAKKRVRESPLKTKNMGV